VRNKIVEAAVNYVAARARRDAARAAHKRLYAETSEAFGGKWEPTCADENVAAAYNLRRRTSDHMGGAFVKLRNAVNAYAVDALAAEPKEGE
jgi:hypothetical protein